MFNPQDLVGRTFLLDKQDDGHRHRAKIVELIEEFENDVAQNPARVKFVCKHVDDDEAEEIITYNQMPRNYQHALRLDELNKSSKWQDSIDTELDQIDEYDTFKDLGYKSKAKPPPGHKKIRVSL